MNVRRIALIAAGALVVGLLILLLHGLGGPSPPAVSADRLAEAKAAHERSVRAQAEARTAPAAPRTPSRVPRRRKPTPRVSAPEVPSEPAMPPPVIPRPRLSVVARASSTTADPATAAMDEANRFYDHGDYEGAYAAAIEILKKTPRNIRMLRIVVSTSCIMGNEQDARDYSRKLPRADVKQMRIRCKRYGIEL